MENELKEIRLSREGKRVFPKLIGREINQIIPLKQSGKDTPMIRVIIEPNIKPAYYHKDFFILLS